MTKSNRVIYLIVIVVVLLLGGCVGALWWTQRGGARTLCPREVFPAGSAELLVLSQRISRSPRWLRVGLDGRIRGDAPIQGTPIAWDAQRLWTTAASGLNLYALPTLAPITAVSSATASHPALQRGTVPKGLRPDGAMVVQGNDRRFYAVTPTGNVELIEEDLRAANDQRRYGLLPLPSVGGPRSLPGAGIGTSEPMPLNLQPAPNPGYRVPDPPPDTPVLRPTSLDLISPRIVMDFGRGTALGLTDPPSFLVLSDERTGPGPNHLLHRVAPDGTIQWTASARALLGDAPFTDPSYRVLYLGGRGDRITAFVTALRVTRYQSGRQEDCLARIVTIVPNSGQVRGRADIVDP